MDLCVVCSSAAVPTMNNSARHPALQSSIMDPRECVPKFLERLRTQRPKAVVSTFLEAVAREPSEKGEPLPASPRISCLMVTRNPLALVRRSIQCYLHQTYPH